MDSGPGTPIDGDLLARTLDAKKRYERLLTEVGHAALTWATTDDLKHLAWLKARAHALAEAYRAWEQLAHELEDEIEASPIS